jgi:hypothetical protein
MAKLFDIIPENLFSILASPNKRIYADALSVLHEAFRENLKIGMGDLFSMLRSRLEGVLSDTDFADEGIEEIEAVDVSGKARFLIRKLKERGWIDIERGEDFDEYIIMPDYCIRLLEVLESLSEDEVRRSFSYVYETYATLKYAHSDKSASNFEKYTTLVGACEKTENLIKALKNVYHNINRYVQSLMDTGDINSILEAHYNEFQSRVIETYIKPLKIQESVPKFKGPIIKIIDSWHANKNLIDSLAEIALAEKTAKTLEECQAGIIRMIYFIKESYEKLEPGFVSEIDTKVRKYTRATTRKISYLSSPDAGIKGDIASLLTRMSDKQTDKDELLARMTPVFDIFSQSYMSSSSLYSRRKPSPRQLQDPVIIDEASMVTDEKSREKYRSVMNSPYGRKKVFDYIEGILCGNDSGDFSGVEIDGIDDYIMTLMAVKESSGKQSFYNIRFEDRELDHGSYVIPNVRITRKPK